MADVSTTTQRHRVQAAWFAMLRINALVIVGVLGLILVFLLERGLSKALSWEFLTQMPREGMTEGGIFPAIFGTVMMVVIMSIAVVPFGVLAALYLKVTQ